jgi:hypothetical protein
VTKAQPLTRVHVLLYRPVRGRQNKVIIKMFREIASKQEGVVCRLV